MRVGDDHSITDPIRKTLGCEVSVGYGALAAATMLFEILRAVAEGHSARRAAAGSASARG